MPRPTPATRTRAAAGTTTTADLTDYGIKTELTSTTRCGFHRYTFPEDKESRVLIDLQFGSEYHLDIREADIRKAGSHRIEGLSTYHSQCWGSDGVQDYTVHFVIEFDRPIKAFGAWHNNKVEPGKSRLQTKAVEDAGAHAEFDTRNDPVVQARVGISLVSIENAALNLKTEVTDGFDWNFDAIRAYHVQAWNDLLGRIEIQTPDRREKVRFYNNLYRSFCRNVRSDVNGQWVDGAEQVRQLPEGDLALGCDAFDPETGYARLRKSDGAFIEDFDFYTSGANKHYVEGNAWQLAFFVPQDVPGLAKAIGIDRFRQRLEWGFEESYKWRFNAPNDLYWDYPVIQGNQQSMHFAYLFNWVQRPWLTQKWSRAIVDRYYGNGLANAYLGDEDQGQMSAWFVMTAIGLFQTDGGCRVNPIYEIGSPLYEKIVIDLGQRYGRGKTFTIEACNVSRNNKYVQSAALNGKKLDTFWFPASELLKGGELVLQMGPEPNRDWATGIEKVPVP